MGIVIAQPDMVSGQVSAGYGAAEQWSKDLPSLVRQQEAISHANLTSAQLQQQASAQSAALLQHGQMFSAQQQAQQREQQYAGEQAITQQAYGIQGQLQQQQQHAELAAWVNSQEMTQADNLRLQRLQQSLSAVQEGVASGQYTPQEAADLTMQLRTGIDPLQQRLKQQQVKQEQMQTKAIETKLAQAKAAEVQNQDFEAKLKEQGHGVMHWTDPDTGRSHMLIQNAQTGEWYNPLQPGGKGGSSRADDAEATDKQVKAIQGKAMLLFPDDQSDPVTGKPHASADVLKQRADFAKEEFQKHEEAHEPQRPFRPGDTESMSKQQIKAVVALGDVLKTVEVPRDDMTDAQRSQAADAIHALHAEIGQYGSLTHPSRPITPEDKKRIETSQDVIQHVKNLNKANAPGSEEARVKAATEKPFDIYKDPGAMTKTQSDRFHELAGIETQIKQNDSIPAEQKAKTVAAVNGLQTLLGKYGFLDGNPKLEKNKADRDKIAEYTKVLGAIPKPPATVPPEAVNPRAASMFRGGSNFIGDSVDWLRERK